MKKVTFICYPKCSTCKKAEQWLKDNHIDYNYRLIKEENPTAEELATWINDSGIPINKFFNTSGILYREQNIKDKFKTHTREELIKILASDGMMVKRPVLLTDNNIFLGFKQEDWEKALL